MNNFELISNQRNLIFWIASSIAVIFLIDIASPLGVADGILYALPVSASLWLNRKWGIYVVTVLSVILIVMGYFLSPPMKEELWVVITNRFYSVFTIIVIAFFCFVYKKSMSKSQEGRVMLESIASDSFDALVKIDFQGKVLAWNRACERIFGWTCDEALGRYVSELIIPVQYRDAHQAGIHRFLTRGDRGIMNQHLEITAQKKDSTEFPVELTVSAIKMDKSYIFSAVIRDISHRKHLEEQNRSYALELSESLNKEKIQRHALEIANTNLSHFSRLLENNLLDLENAYLQTLNSLSLAAEFKDEDTGQHLARISKFSGILAKAAGLSEDEVNNIILASPMHDIGKVGVADDILRKKGKLTYEEFNATKEHTSIGASILGISTASIIELAREIAHSHHEKWNGRGYPRCIAGEEIPLAGRIVSLVDCFDALTSERPYKDPYPLDMAFKIILEERGKSFDPYLVDCFVKVFDEFKQIVVLNATYSTVKPFQLSERDQVSIDH